jgi:hypothetical protein
MTGASIETWDVGAEPEPLTFTVTPEWNQQYLFAQEDYDPDLYLGPDAVVHPALLLNMSNMTNSPSFHRDAHIGGLHARDEVTFREPLPVNTEVQISWKLIEVYERRGRLYHVRDCDIRTSGGNQIMRRKTYVTFIQKGKRQASTGKKESSND